METITLNNLVEATAEQYLAFLDSGHVENTEFYRPKANQNRPVITRIFNNETNTFFVLVCEYTNGILSGHKYYTQPSTIGQQS